MLHGMDLSSSSSSSSSCSSRSSDGRNIMFDSSSDDEADALYRVPRVCIRNYENTIHEYSEKEFIKHFRMSRDVALQVIQQFSESDIYTNIVSGNYILQ